MAAATSYHKLSSVTEIDSLVALDARGRKSRCWQSPAPSGGSRGGLVPYLFWLLVAAIILRLRLVHSSLRLCLQVTFSSSVCLISLCLSLKRILVMAFRDHLANAGLFSYFKVLNHSLQRSFFQVK